MPYKTVNDVKLYYEVFGDKRGVAVVLNSGGQQGGECMRDFARCFKRPGVKFLMWDRRNSLGKSNVLFDDALSRTMSEPQVQAEDLCELMKATNMYPAILIGNSTGAYLSLKLASMHPEAVYGVVAMNTPGGLLAAEVLSHSFYGEYKRQAGSAGMEAVMGSKFYADMIKLNPAVKETMSKTEEGFFIDYMLRNEQFIKRSADWPAIAIFESELKLMQNLVLVVHNFGPGDCDGIHKESVSRKIKELVPNSHLVVGMDARKWIPPIREFIKSFVSASYFNDPTAR